MIEKLIVTIHKTSDSTGTATLQFVGADQEELVVINQIGIDLNDGANPIAVPRMGGVLIAQGSLVEDSKSHVLELFTAGEDLGVGIYVYSVDLWEE